MIEIKLRLHPNMVKAFDRKLKKENGMPRDHVIALMILSYLDDSLTMADLKNVKLSQEKIEYMEERLLELEYAVKNINISKMLNSDRLEKEEKYVYQKLLSRKTLTASQMYNLNRSMMVSIENTGKIFKLLVDKGMAKLSNTKKGIKIEII